MTIVVPGVVTGVQGPVVSLPCTSNPMGTGVVGPQDQLVATASSTLITGSVISTLTIQPSEWRNVFTVAVAERDDRITEGPRNVSISLRVFSNDTNYGGVNGAESFGQGSCATSLPVLPITDTNSAHQHPSLAASYARGRVMMMTSPDADTSACPLRVAMPITATILEPAFTAPMLTSASLSDDLSSIKLTFSGDIEAGTGAGTVRQCSQLFTVAPSSAGPTRDGCAAPTAYDVNASSTRLAADYCVKVDPRTLVARLRTESQLSVNDTITLISGAIRAAGSAQVMVVGNVAITAPPTAVAPRVDLGPSRSISPCEGLKLSAYVTGTAGRNAPIVWRVTSAADETGADVSGSAVVTNLQNTLSAITGPNLALSADAIQAGWTITVQATVTSFIGRSASAAVTVKKASLPLPQLMPVGATSFAITASQPLRLSVRALAPSCGGASASTSDRAMSFYWYDVTNGGLPELSIDANADLFAPATSASAVPFPLPGNLPTAIPLMSAYGRALALPGFRLRADDNYTFAVYAVMNGTTAYASMSFTVNVQGDPLVASIGGGQLRTVSAIDDVIINASASFDPSSPSSTIDALYSWSCAPSASANAASGAVATGDSNSTCGGIDFTAFTTPVLRVPAGSLTPLATYDISLTYRLGSRSAVATQRIVVAPAAVLELTIATLRQIQGRVPANAPSQLLYARVVTLNVQSKFTINWMQKSGPTAAILSQTDSGVIQLAGPLQPDSSYTFCAEATAAGYSLSSACTTFLTSDIPRLTTLTVAPVSASNSTAFAPYVISLGAISGDVSVIEYRYLPSTASDVSVAGSLLDTRGPFERVFTTASLPAGNWTIAATAIGAYGGRATVLSPVISIGSYKGTVDDALRLATAAATDGDATQTNPALSGAAAILSKGSNSTNTSGGRSLHSIRGGRGLQNIVRSISTDQMTTLLSLAGSAITQTAQTPSLSLWQATVRNVILVVQSIKAASATGTFDSARTTISTLISSVRDYIAAYEGEIEPTDAAELLSLALSAQATFLDTTDAAALSEYLALTRNATLAQLVSGGAPSVTSGGSVITSLAKRGASDLASTMIAATSSGSSLSLPRVSFTDSASSAVAAALGSSSASTTVSLTRCSSGACGSGASSLVGAIYDPVQISLLDDVSNEVHVSAPLSSSPVMEFQLPSSVAAAACAESSSTFAPGTLVPTGMYWNITSSQWRHDGVRLACSNDTVPALSLRAWHLTTFSVVSEPAALILVASGSGSVPSSTSTTINAVEGTVNVLSVALSVQPDYDVTITLDAPSGVCYDDSTPSSAAASWLSAVFCSLTNPCVAGTCLSTGVTLSSTTLTFTPVDWAIAQFVSLTAPADGVYEGRQQYAVRLTTISVDARFGVSNPGANVTVSVTEPDAVPAVVADWSALPSTISEASPTTYTYSVVLASQPLDDVTVSAVISGSRLAASGPTSRTFTSANWMTAQALSFVTVNDAIANGISTITISHTIASIDPRYAALPAGPNRSVTVTDDDVAAVIMPASLSRASILEGRDSATFTVALTSQPTGPIIVNVDVSTPTVHWNVAVAVNDGSSTAIASLTGGSGRASFTITDSTWASARTVSITAAADSTQTGDGNISAAVTVDVSAAAEYVALPSSQLSRSYAVQILDADTPGIDVSTPAGAVGGAIIMSASASTTCNVALVTPTSSTVVIDLAVSAPLNAGYPAAVALTPSSVTFTPVTYNSPQSVTVQVSGSFDYALPTSALTITQTIDASLTTDATYLSAAPRSFRLNLLGLPTAAVTLAITGATMVIEGGSTSVSVSVSSRPLTPFTIALQRVSSSGPVLTFTPPTLTIDSSNWQSPASVVVGLPDDDTQWPAADLMAYQISSTVTAGDANYVALAPSMAALALTENDVASVIVTLVDPTHKLAAAVSQAQVLVSLSTTPIAPVTLTITTVGEPNVMPSLTSLVLSNTTARLITLSATSGLTSSSSVVLHVTPSSSSGGDAVYGALAGIQTIIPSEAAPTTGGSAGSDLGPGPLAGETNFRVCVVLRMHCHPLQANCARVLPLLPLTCVSRLHYCRHHHRCAGWCCDGRGTDRLCTPPLHARSPRLHRRSITL